jgi:hypothetical protein
MESWKRVCREGVAPLLSDEALAVLGRALSADSPELVQGATTSPPPLSIVADWPVAGACVLGYCGWRGEGLETVGEVEEFFAKMCYAIDRRLGEAAACRWFLNWFDETPREAMRAALLAEVERSCRERRGDDEMTEPAAGWFEDEPPDTAA